MARPGAYLGIAQGAEVGGGARSVEPQGNPFQNKKLFGFGALFFGRGPIL